MNCLKPQLTMLAALLALTTASVTSRAEAIAHWTFDEISGPVAHDSVGSFNGNLSASGATFVSGGISGNAISLSQAANGFVNMGNVLNFTSQPFSVVAWLKTAPGYSISDSAIVSKHAASYQNGFWLMANTAGGGGQTGKAIFGEGAAWASVTSSTSVNDGNWHQIVATFNPNASLKIYVDGTPAEASFPASSSLVANNVAFLIGGVNSGAPEGRMTGMIDEVQIYNQALSDGDVDFLFQHPGQVVLDCSQQLAAVQAQLAAANDVNAALQEQLASCNNALAAANENIQDLVLPLQVLTQDFRTTFKDPTFQIRGATSVEQMQNLVSEILDLPRGQQQKLFINLGGHHSQSKLFRNDGQ